MFAVWKGFLVSVFSSRTVINLLLFFATLWAFGLVLSKAVHLPLRDSLRDICIFLVPVVYGVGIAVITRHFADGGGIAATPRDLVSGVPFWWLYLGLGGLFSLQTNSVLGTDRPELVVPLLARGLFSWFSLAVFLIAYFVMLP